MKPIFAGCAVLLLLPVANAIAPQQLPFLPLGGSTIAEIGIVLGICAAIVTIRETLRSEKDEKDKSDNNS